MHIQEAKKMAFFPETIFGELKQAAAKKAETGAKVIDLSLGSPDIPPKKIVRDKLAEMTRLKSMYGYTLGGIARFNEAVARYYKRRSNVDLDPKTEVLQTMGSQEGLVHLPLAFCNEGDIVLTTNPAYIAYDTGIHLAGATPYYMPLREENDFLPDLTAIPENVLQKAKLLILNLPGNPVPAMPTEAFFEEVVQFAKTYNILVLHDAAYSEYYFTGSKPLSFLETPDAKDVGIEINSLSKSFSLAGARIAYFVGSRKAIEILRKFKSNLDYGTFQPIQEAAIVALDHAEQITDELRTTFSRRHELLMTGLQELDWKATRSKGGMFIWSKYPYDIPTETFAFQLVEQTGVAVVPGTIFGSEGEGFVRIALVQDEQTLEQAIEALRSFRP